MKTKSLANTNHHLKRSSSTEQWIVRNIASSTAVETKQAVSTVISRANILHSSRPAKLHKKHASQVHYFQNGPDESLRYTHTGAL